MKHFSVVLFLVLSSFLCACGSSGGSPSAGAAAAPFVPGTIKQMDLQHGLGFLCWVSDSKEQLWCWASEQAAIDNGDAGLVGLTSLIPTEVFHVGPGVTITQLIYDHAICWNLSNEGTYVRCNGTTSGTLNGSPETAACTELTLDSVNCPGEANPDLTFPGITLSLFEYPRDVMRKHSPFSPTHEHLRGIT